MLARQSSRPLVRTSTDILCRKMVFETFRHESCVLSLCADAAIAMLDPHTLPKRVRLTCKVLLIIALLGASSLRSAGQEGTGGAPETEVGSVTDAQMSCQPQPEATFPAIKPPTQPPLAQETVNSIGNQENVKQNQADATSRDRLFFALPNFLTLEKAGLVPPLTASEKFKVTARSSFDPVEYFWYAALAGISQAENSEPGFGQGAVGYGKRYGAYLADGTIENFMTVAILPSLLHQDPRYFQMGKGGVWRRAGYAVSHIFVTRNDYGQIQFNWSEILGSAVSAGVSTYTYHPVGDRKLPNAMSVWGTQIGYYTLTYVVKEFWPDIRRRLQRSRVGQIH